MIRETTTRLDVPSLEQRAGFATLEKTIAVHDAAMADLPFMNAVEIGGAASVQAPLPFPLTVAAWNLERCLFPEESATHLRRTGADVVLLSEMDNGMARTAQRHPTAELAGVLGMTYTYGIEFVALALGSEIERTFCRDAFNDKGFHGNAMMTSGALAQPFMIRLWGERLWFTNGGTQPGMGDQPRIGERCAIGAVIDTTEGPFVAVSVHLESAANAPYRERQVLDLIDRIEAAFPGLPILIGGDLNTGNQADGDFEAEGLFAGGAARGFQRHGGPIDRMTTRPSLITRLPTRAMKLDWFLARGLSIRDSAVIPSLDDTGRPLSDHDLITCVIEGFT